MNSKEHKTKFLPFTPELQMIRARHMRSNSIEKASADFHDRRLCSFLEKDR